MILAALTFALTTSTFKPDGWMPKRTVYDKSGCTGENRSPELRWTGVPAGTKSFAIVMHDPDAPVPGGWYHWVVYDLPASMTELPENAKIDDTRLGTTSFGEHPYGGPCPPPGKPHHYNFTIYALDVRQIDGHPTGAELLGKIQKHVLGQAAVTGLYGRR